MTTALAQEELATLAEANAAAPKNPGIWEKFFRPESGFNLDVGDISVTMWITLVAIAVLGVILFVISRQKKRWSSRMLANAALCIALGYILSFIKLADFPQGGSVTLASMLPVCLFAYAYGIGPGFLVGIAFGFIGMINGAYVIHPVQMLLDYPLPYAMLGLAGLLRGKCSEKAALPAGIAIAACARLVMHVLSGVVFFAEYAGDMNPWLYSIAYNCAYLVPDTIICVLLSCIPAVRKTALRLSQNER